MAQQQISPASRIRDLSSINEDLTAILQYASAAIHALSPNPDPTNTEAPPPNLDARKSDFETQSRHMFTALQSGTARLRRQVYALEEAGVITAQANMAAATGSQQQGEAEKLVNGGLGGLDVGWLNSRGNRVGGVKEGELIEEAQDLARSELRGAGETEGTG
ncbi:hypothetical protein B0A50_04026 [Salinomyces thailandicus]|uniref:Mediator of RNA polymerase II transcription subunit 11 n=1 Tax=Salinomyces thailandicus TaxID=706561 RepID=A0A4U0TZE8_9PEZI|nr:hypothetical protein B0A50_04026 [Salinomyces thailandica]